MKADRPNIPDPSLRERTKELCKLWQEAVADDSPGVSPAEVIERLEQKYATSVAS